jgi:hypothetical protein
MRGSASETNKVIQVPAGHLIDELLFVLHRCDEMRELVLVFVLHYCSYREIFLVCL